MLDHDFMWEVDPAPGPMRKQEEQASAQALLQIGTQIAPIVAAMSQGGMGRMIRLDLLFEDLLKVAGKTDYERYFASAPPPPQVAQAAGGGQPGATNGTAPPGPNLGVTAPSAADATSPSSGVSLSPEVMNQRAMAMGGGVN
jgi:hypothetical protein